MFPKVVKTFSHFTYTPSSELLLDVSVQDGCLSFPSKTEYKYSSFWLLLPSWICAFRWTFYWNQIFLLTVPHICFEFLSIRILAHVPVLYLLIDHPSFKAPFISLPSWVISWAVKVKFSLQTPRTFPMCPIQFSYHLVTTWLDSNSVLCGSAILLLLCTVLSFTRNHLEDTCLL